MKSYFKNLLFIVLIIGGTVCSSCGEKTVYPEIYGLSPEASSAINTEALQKALDGGKKKVFVRQAGIYKLNSTVFIDSDTEFECAEGVIFQKDTIYTNMFLNRGAIRHEYDSNISITGLCLSVNGYDRTPNAESPVFGLRAQLAILCAHNVRINNYKCEDLGKMQYGIQFNQCDNITLDGFVIRGDKDGVHISSCDNFIIRNGICHTYDDCIALNASDWSSSNCVDGDISNGLIENVTDEKMEPHSGEFCRLLTGAWIDWHYGVDVRRSDMFVYDGKLYKVLAPVKDTSFISLTPPSITSFEGVENDPAGFSWKLVRNDKVYYSTNIRNITFRGMKAESNRSGFCEEIFLGNDEWARTFHCEVSDPKQFPSYDNICIEDSDLSGLSFNFWSCDKANSDVTFRNVRGIVHGFMVQGPSDSTLVNSAKFISCDFTSNKEDWDFDVFNGGNVLIKDCKFATEPRFRRSDGKIVIE